MPWDLFVDSANSVSFEPEWDFLQENVKVEDAHRVRSGAMFRYRWGGYERWKFTARFIDSADAWAVNSWWDSNTKLLFMNTSDATVNSVQIVNSRLPFGRFIKPHDDLYEGVIELETY